MNDMVEVDGYLKHPTAIVDHGAQIGKGSKVWHFAHICSGAKIGEKSVFGQNVFVGNRVTIGKNCKVQNNVSIYDNVHLEDDVFCGPSMVFTNVINPRSAVVRKDEYLDTIVKKGATIGANATVVCGVTLGEYCFIAAGAVITKDVKPFALMAGVPAKQIGWMSRFGERVALPVMKPNEVGEFTCPETGDRYQLKNGDLSLIGVS
jgi:UDP-2-acetamido-3-amino-2,3-dideoxy-glucuronate N-acetyltransferase